MYHSLSLMLSRTMPNENDQFGNGTLDQYLVNLLREKINPDGFDDLTLSSITLTNNIKWQNFHNFF